MFLLCMYMLLFLLGFILLDTFQPDISEFPKEYFFLTLFRYLWEQVASHKPHLPLVHCASDRLVRWVSDCLFKTVLCFSGSYCFRIL